MKRLKKLAAFAACLLLIGVCAAFGACGDKDSSPGKTDKPGVELPAVPFSLTQTDEGYSPAP